MEMLREADTSFAVPENPDDIDFGTPDELVTTAVDNAGWGQAKIDALLAYPTQVSVENPYFALSNMLGREIMAVEHFRLVRGEAAGERDGDGRETDLFAGL
jgi:N-acetyl-1-D-myo-inositol-2-amino-2-deoxy-alpha-D-glucopyranoside deacetylase